MSKAALLGRAVYGEGAGGSFKLSNRALSMLSAIGLVFVLTSTVWGAERPPTPSPADTTEANITLVTAGFLEHSQLAHHPLDSELAGRFLDRYLDDLDGSRSLFLQSDVKEFAAYRATLAQAIHKDGDTSAAHAIFARYLERLAQRSAYVTDLLRTAKFDFTGHDIYAFDRQTGGAAARFAGGREHLAAAAPRRVSAGEAGRTSRPTRSCMRSCAGKRTSSRP